MAVTFSILWQNHPTTKGDNAPCKSSGGKPNYKYQCAIRMGVCLTAAGVSMRTLRGARCWHGHGRKHVLRAQELASWLKTQIAQIGRVSVQKNVTHTDFAGKKGIVFFRNFWGRGGQGDHIDLWDGSRVRKGKLDYFQRSQEVWFWPIS